MGGSVLPTAGSEQGARVDQGQLRGEDEQGPIFSPPHVHLDLGKRGAMLPQHRARPRAPSPYPCGKGAPVPQPPCRGSSSGAQAGQNLTYTGGLAHPAPSV